MKMNLSIGPSLNLSGRVYDAKMIRWTGRGPKEKSAEELSDNDEREENQKVRTLRD